MLIVSSRKEFLRHETVIMACCQWCKFLCFYQDEVIKIFFKTVMKILSIKKFIENAVSSIMTSFFKKMRCCQFCNGVQNFWTVSWFQKSKTSCCQLISIQKLALRQPIKIETLKPLPVNFYAPNKRYALFAPPQTWFLQIRFFDIQQTVCRCFESLKLWNEKTLCGQRVRSINQRRQNDSKIPNRVTHYSRLCATCLR